MTTAHQLTFSVAVRSGFPSVCPTGRAYPVNGANCQGCESYECTAKGTRRCVNSIYQFQPGIHHCSQCGTELTPNDETLGSRLCKVCEVYAE